MCTNMSFKYIKSVLTFQGSGIKKSFSNKVRLGKNFFYEFGSDISLGPDSNTHHASYSKL